MIFAYPDAPFPFLAAERVHPAGKAPEMEGAQRRRVPLGTGPMGS